MVRRPPTLHDLRAALWALRAVRSARRQLRRSGYEGLKLPPMPQLPVSARRGLNGVLKRLPSTCLERAIVLQQWRAAHGDARDVVVGVSGAGIDFRAHAWLEDERQTPDTTEFRELVRLKP